MESWINADVIIITNSIIYIEVRSVRKVRGKNIEYNAGIDFPFK